ncbi:uncharacterized protein A1O5_10841 [Cladophialophora psammophila CBS 110553]|uniref:AB hydrolase-1 domain-containing protein n=1 Tax=Cladophialophora psammophila CBS 110553 TaxID=1182543 RepID=W9WMI1_9EURO|nr:uncharacterized protein A1O5_10841 [Cladophialophora psammophila CBS 110553]EXJ66225.1 hypothetical protein A1O5_10841 [Cladophialophora psammophila CBS 110553]
MSGEVQEFYQHPRKVSTSGGATVNFHSRGLSGVSRGDTVLVLLHGYPQSSYMFRWLIPLLPSHLPLFVPDLPGYGDSTANSLRHDKRTVGTAILEALKKSLPSQGDELPKIIIAGHDRGARVCHRLAVDAPDILSFEIVSVIFLDIVPTAVQWNTFDNPKSAASKFHWSLLANVEIATKLITSHGGGSWCSELIHRWAGRNERRRARLLNPEALAVYCRHFDNDSVVRASCEDYRAGAFEDDDLQREDQKVGNKIGIPTLVVYSESFTGAAYNVESIWRDWCTEGTRVETKAIGDGTGHFLPEEAPEETADIMNIWIKQWIK